jgi:hypothetical protein
MIDQSVPVDLIPHDMVIPETENSESCVELLCTECNVLCAMGIYVYISLFNFVFILYIHEVCMCMYLFRYVTISCTQSLTMYVSTRTSLADKKPTITVCTNIYIHFGS